MSDEIAALIEPLIPSLRRYARALLYDRDAADDLVQDTLERAISRWPLRRRDGDLRSWLFTIERNLCLAGLRQTRRRGVHVGIDPLESLPSKEHSPDATLRVQDVLAGLAGLPEEQRSVLLLVAVEEFSYADTAKVLDVPIGTVMSRLSRARDRMRSFMETGQVVVLRSVK